MPDRRVWIRELSSTPGAISAIRAAAETAMREVCDRHPPEKCDCTIQMMTPIEFAHWIEREILRAARGPLRLDHSENRRAGQHHRHTVNAAAS